ncbi:MAG: DUF1002 domain-containing protein [Blautia sp.]|jgi:uncharacterized protein YpuA (DUF1002 family)
MKIKKLRKFGVLLLAGMMLLLSPMQVFADREDAIIDKPYVSLGADLNETEKATVLGLLGIQESDLLDYTVAKITNADEHKYLDAYLDSSVIGTRALSSVLVRGKEEGYGIKVTTKNISYCTVGMYQNALATAGIKNADIIVAGPFQISGTAGLVGAIKSYENMTGQAIDDKDVDVATNELVITSELGEAFQDSGKAEELVGFIKNEVVSKDLTEEEINSLVTQAADEFQVNLSDEDREKIVQLMEQIKGLDLNVDDLKEQVSGLYEKIKGLDLNIDLDKEQVDGFLSNLFNKIVEFFKNLFN